MNKAASMGMGMLSGLVVGAAVGMLVAPKSGVDTRDMLKEKAEDMRTKAGETVNRLRRRGASVLEGMSSSEIE